jgi:iron(III) transport system substrate-binding protein
VSALRRCAAALAALLLASLAAASEPVVLYTSADQEHAEVILQSLQRQGLAVRAVFDAEASKAVGLERRLTAERGRPVADVFWNSEFLRTWRLLRAGVLQATPASAGAGVAGDFCGRQVACFGVRSRVLALHRPSMEGQPRPTSVADLADPRWARRVAIARPLFGTTSTHFAALHAAWGEARFVEFLQALKRNQVMILPGNGDVRDAVVAGKAWIGLTDTDDVVGALRRGQPVDMVFPDQSADGAFSVYMTAAVVSHAAHPAEAARLVQALSAEAVERRLIEIGAVQMPLRAALPGAPEIGAQRPRLWFVDPARIEASLDRSIRLIREHLL